MLLAMLALLPVLPQPLPLVFVLGLPRSPARACEPSRSLRIRSRGLAGSGLVARCARAEPGLSNDTKNRLGTNIMKEALGIVPCRLRSSWLYSAGLYIGQA